MVGDTRHLKGSLGWAGSPSQRLDLNKGWTGGLGSQESHRGCAWRQGETKGFDLTMKGEQMTQEGLDNRGPEKLMGN